MSAYTEDTLVQQTTAEYLEQELGWESVYAYNHEDFGPANLLGRSSDRAVVLTRPLRANVVGLTPGLPQAAHHDPARPNLPPPRTPPPPDGRRRPQRPARRPPG